MRAARSVYDQLPKSVQSALVRGLDRPELHRSVRRPRWGNLRRPRPFSDRFGFDRGTPVDRHFIELFVDACRSDVRGRVLEVRDSTYARRVGGAVSIDILDVDPRNDTATVIADLSEPGSLPASAFDCAIVTQTLQYVKNPIIAVGNLHRCLAPGGVLLVSVPSIAKIDHHAVDTDRWRMLPNGLHDVLTTAFDVQDVEISSFGNLVAATAFLYGMAVEELRPADLSAVDPLFPMLSCARVRRGN